MIKDLEGAMFWGYTIHLKIAKDKNPSSNNYEIPTIGRKLDMRLIQEQEDIPKSKIHAQPRTEQPRTEKPAEIIVEQPKHKHFTLDLDEEKKEERKRAVIGTTTEDQWRDSLQEKILLAGYESMTIKGITYCKFLIIISFDRRQKYIGYRFPKGVVQYNQ